MVKSCGVGSAPASCTLMPNSTTNRLYCGPAVSTCRRSAVRLRQRQAPLRSGWRHAQRILGHSRLKTHSV